MRPEREPGPVSSTTMKPPNARRGSLALPLLVMLLTALTALGAGTSRLAAPGKPNSVVTGSVAFQDVPVDASGLHVPQPQDPFILEPAVGVTVQVVDAVTKQVLAETATAIDGTYGVAVSGAAVNKRGLIYVRALAETYVARVLHRRTHSLFSIRSRIVRIRNGLTSVPPLEALDEGRASGPFHILATLARGAEVVTPPGTLGFTPTCTVFWDTVSATGTRADTPNRWIYLVGDRRRDSDEFDESVILHEYGHIAAAALSRDESPGGEHDLGENVDPRLAWSEGWATYLAQSILGSPVYIDSTGNNGSVVTSYSLAPTHLGAASGYHSEFTVASLLWHALGTGATPHLGATQAQIQLAFRSLVTERQVYLIDFCAKLRNPSISTLEEYQAFLNAFDIHFFAEYPFVADPFPAPLHCRIPESGTVDSVTEQRANLADSAAFYEFDQLSSTPEMVHIELERIAAPDPQAANLELYLYGPAGTVVGRSELLGGGASTGTIELSLPRGSYALEVRSYQTGDDARLRFNSALYRLTRIHPTRDALILDLGTLDPDPDVPPSAPPRYLGSALGFALSNSNPPLATGMATNPNDNFYRAFLWDSLTGPVDPGAGTDSQGTGVNAAGAICGTMYSHPDNVGHAFYLPDGGAPQVLLLPNVVAAAQASSNANGMNEGGRVVGSSQISLRSAQNNNVYSTTLGFVTGPGGSSLTALGTLTDQTDTMNPIPYAGTSTAFAVSTSGVVVGSASAPGGWRRAVRWSGGPDPVDLGTLSPDAGDPSGFVGDSAALGINANGVIVGSATAPLLGQVACVWEGGAAVALSQRPGTGFGRYSVARSINGSNMIVGEAGVLPALPSPIALLWRKVNGAWVEEELTAKICPDERWKLNYALGINDFGWVVGYGEKGASQTTRAYALRLIAPGPAQLPGSRRTRGRR